MLRCTSCRCILLPGDELRCARCETRYAGLALGVVVVGVVGLLGWLIGGVG